MMSGASGGFRDTGSAAASSAWTCLLLFVLVFAGAGIQLWLEATVEILENSWELRANWESLIRW